MWLTVFRLIERDNDGITFWGEFEPAHAQRVCGYFSKFEDIALLSRMYVVDSDNNWMSFDDFCREVKANEALL